MTTARNAQQLSLFPAERNVPERFRLDEATRRRGMRHIARLRAQLEARHPTSPAARSPDRPSTTAA